MSRILSSLVLCAAFLSTGVLLAQDDSTPRAAPDASVLSDKQWEQLDQSVKRGLQWLAKQQNADGSFRSVAPGQPAVTSFCLMAFLAQGESPSDGEYKLQLSKAIDFIVSQQKPNGS